MRARTIAAILAMTAAPPAFAQAAAPMTPAQTVAAAQSGDVEGVFEFVVGSTGAGGFSAYLNSSADYRDPGNLAVVLDTNVRNALKNKLGGHAEDLLKGKRIRVKGVARRVPIGSHFQTRIAVETADQIEILG
jgi:hypothetical protein